MSRRAGTKRPSSSGSSSKHVLSSSGVPWQAKIPSPRLIRAGRLYSDRRCSALSAFLANLPADESLSSGNSSIHRSWFPRTVGNASDWRASKVSFGHKGLVTQSPRLTVKSTPRLFTSASTASKAGRFPWTSEMTAIHIGRSLQWRQISFRTELNPLLVTVAGQSGPKRPPSDLICPFASILACLPHVRLGANLGMRLCRAGTPVPRHRTCRRER
jgi:hypothetical protein